MDPTADDISAFKSIQDVFRWAAVGVGASRRLLDIVGWTDATHFRHLAAMSRDEYERLVNGLTNAEGSTFSPGVYVAAKLAGRAARVACGLELAARETREDATSAAAASAAPPPVHGVGCVAQGIRADTRAQAILAVAPAPAVTVEPTPAPSRAEAIRLQSAASSSTEATEPPKKKMRPLDAFFAAKQPGQHPWVGPLDLSVHGLRRKAEDDKAGVGNASGGREPSGVTPNSEGERQKKAKARASSTSLFRGRVVGTAELLLSKKMAIVQWAQREGLIDKGRTGLFQKTSPKQYVDTEWAGDTKRRKVNAIREWANQSIADGWAEFERHPEMQALYGPSPLSVTRRLPQMWANVWPAGSMARRRNPGDGSGVGGLEHPASQVRVRGRKALKERHPLVIELLVGKLVLLVEDARDNAAGEAPVCVDTEWIFNTWHTLVKEHNRQAKLLADPPIRGYRKDGQFSWSWVRTMAIEAGLLCQSSGSKEDKPPEPADCDEYEAEVVRVMTDHQIDPRAMFLLDEYNDFKYLPPNSVVTSKAERNRSGPAANQKAHAPTRSGGRKSVTCGLGLTPTWIGRAFVLVDGASVETQKLISDVLGKHVVLLVNSTGNVCGSTHVDLVMKKYLGPESARMKRALSLDEGAPFFYGEDHAPGHYHDNCTVTKRNDLNAERKEFFTSVNAWRKLTPKKGTPRYMVGDQLHQVFKHRCHKRLEWLIGNSKDLMHLRFVKDLCRRGGLFLTTKGYQRGPTLFLFCLAVAIERSLLTTHMVLAAFCKCGFFNIAECDKLLGVKDELIKEGQAELDQAQKDLVALHVWLAPEHDFSGQPKKAQYASWGGLERLPVQANPALRARALQLLKEEEEDRKKLLKLHPVSLDEFTEIQNQAKPAGVEKNIEIVPREKGKGHGALAQLAQTPDSTNAGHIEQFRRVFKQLFSKTKLFCSKTPHHMELVADFQLLLLKQRFLAQREQSSAYVALKNVHDFIWSILVKVHRLPIQPDRERLLLHIIGDFKTYSLTPTGRRDPDGGQEVMDD